MRKLNKANFKSILVILWFQCVSPGWAQVEGIGEQASRLGLLQEKVERMSGRSLSTDEAHTIALDYSSSLSKFDMEHGKLFKKIGKEKMTATMVAWLTDRSLHKRQIALLYSGQLSSDKQAEIVKLTKKKIAEMQKSTKRRDRQSGSQLVIDYQKQQLLFVGANKEIPWKKTSQKKLLEALLK